MNAQLPADVDAEQQILGSLMVRPDLIVPISNILRKEDFFLQHHRIIFETIELLSRTETTEIEPLRLIQYFTDRKQLESAGGAAYIMRLVDQAIAPSNATYHAQRVHNLAIRRSLIEKLIQLSKEAQEPQENEGAFLKHVEEELLHVTSRSSTHGIQPIEHFKKDFVDYIAKLIDARGGMTGTPTRFDQFDRLTSGLRGGELLILAARPGMGKSTFAMNMATNIAIHQNRPVIIYSLEMSKLELILRILSAEAQINHSDLKRGHIPPNKQGPIKDAIARIFAAPIYIDDSGTLDIWDCITRTRKLDIELKKKGHPPGLVVIDYLQLMSDTENRKFGRQNEVAAVSRSLKQLAMKTELPILALSQMNRSVEQRRGDFARPQLSDLRESGAIEQDADIVLFIHREQFSDPDSPEALENRGRAEIIVAKHRNGPQGSFKVAYRPEIFRFDNLDTGDISGPSKY
jgi:replicative DNA helicase